MLANLVGTISSKPKIGNIGLLIAGYGLGQGSIFLMQTWLVSAGRLETLANFGVHFSFAMLCILVVDAGATVALARTIVRERARSDSFDIWQRYSETCVVRLLVCLLVLVVAFSFVALVTTDSFTWDYAIFASPALVFWSFNPVGMLDGLRFSGVSGVTSSIPNLVSALALLLIAVWPDTNEGMALGVAFSVGYALAVIIQFRALAVAGHKFCVSPPRLSGVRQAASDGWMLLGNVLPGQLYFRAQLQFSSSYLGPEATAVFIYVKQILVAVAQLIGFVRRVEFPDLVNALSTPHSSPLSVIATTQKVGTKITLALSGLLLAGGAVVYLTGGSRFEHIGAIIAFFSPFMILNSLSLTLGQGLAALGRYRPLMIFTGLSTFAGVAVSYGLTTSLGIYGLFIGDIVSDAVNVAACILLFTWTAKRIVQ